MYLRAQEDYTNKILCSDRAPTLRYDVQHRHWHEIVFRFDSQSHPSTRTDQRSCILSHNWTIEVNAFNCISEYYIYTCVMCVCAVLISLHIVNALAKHPLWIVNYFLNRTSHVPPFVCLWCAHTTQQLYAYLLCVYVCVPPALAHVMYTVYQSVILHTNCARVNCECVRSVFNAGPVCVHVCVSDRFVPKWQNTNQRNMHHMRMFGVYVLHVRTPQHRIHREFRAREHRDDAWCSARLSWDDDY